MKIILILRNIFRAISILALYEICIKGFSFIISHLFEGDTILILLIVIPSTFIMRFYAIIFYDKNKVDILGIEALKARTLTQKETMISKIIQSLLRFGKIAVYLIVVIDSTATVIYFRKGSMQWDGISDKKTWMLFILSSVICSITIVLVSLGIIKIF